MLLGSYADMNTFELSEYGKTKKDFINTTLGMKGIKANVPFAVVMPLKNRIIQIGGSHKVHEGRSQYLGYDLDRADIKWFCHVEDVLKILFARLGDDIGNEGHVITNSRFGDVFDIIYADASDEVLSRYEYLIDASPEGSFIASKAGSGLKIVDSSDLDKMEAELQVLVREVMPAYADGLCWLVSTDENGGRYFTIFNNSGNERSLTEGDIIHREADRTVRVTFKEDVPSLDIHRTSALAATVAKIDDRNYDVTVPAAGFAVLKY